MQIEKNVCRKLDLPSISSPRVAYDDNAIILTARNVEFINYEVINDTNSSSSSSNDEVIQKAIALRSWKSIFNQDRGEDIEWSDILFAAHKTICSSNTLTPLTSPRISGGKNLVSTCSDSLVAMKNEQTTNPLISSTISNITCNSIASELMLYTEVPGTDSIIGKGTFGVVLKAIWRRKKSIYNDLVNGFEDVDVAIKLLTVPSNSGGAHSSTMEYEALRYRAYKEAAIMTRAKQKIKSTSHIIDAYGVIESEIPSSIATLLRLPENEKCICLVTRYEGGGSLHSLIASNNKNKIWMPLIEKLRLLYEIIQGIYELHSVGIIHADIKPENILLSDDMPSHVRLADFGLSMLRDMNEVNNTSSALSNTASLSKQLSGHINPNNNNIEHGNEKQTKICQKRKSINLGSNKLRISILTKAARTQGTMTYCAPEMLVNPTLVTMSVDEMSMVAKPSRLTDVYAFALLSWQVLSQRRPFSEVQGEVMLCSEVHKGLRPCISKLPKNTPREVIDLIQRCWHNDRSQRLTAEKCLEILKTCYNSLCEASAAPTSATSASASATSTNSTAPQTVNTSTNGNLNKSKEHSLVVPLPTFDRPKSIGISRSIITSTSNSPTTKSYRSDSITSEANVPMDSLKVMPIDYATMINMLKIRIGKSISSPSRNQNNTGFHSHRLSDSGDDYSFNAGELESFYSFDVDETVTIDSGLIPSPVGMMTGRRGGGSYSNSNRNRNSPFKSPLVTSRSSINNSSNRSENNNNSNNNSNRNHHNHISPRQLHFLLEGRDSSLIDHHPEPLLAVSTTMLCSEQKIKESHQQIPDNIIHNNKQSTESNNINNSHIEDIQMHVRGSANSNSLSSFPSTSSSQSGNSHRVFASLKVHCASSFSSAMSSIISPPTSPKSVSGETKSDFRDTANTSNNINTNTPKAKLDTVQEHVKTSTFTATVNAKSPRFDAVLSSATIQKKSSWRDMLSTVMNQSPTKTKQVAPMYIDAFASDISYSQQQQQSRDESKTQTHDDTVKSKEEVRQKLTIDTDTDTARETPQTTSRSNINTARSNNITSRVNNKEKVTSPRSSKVSLIKAHVNNDDCSCTKVINNTVSTTTTTTKATTTSSSVSTTTTTTTTATNTTITKTIPTSPLKSTASFFNRLLSQSPSLRVNVNTNTNVNVNIGLSTDCATTAPVSPVCPEKNKNTTNSNFVSRIQLPPSASIDKNSKPNPVTTKTPYSPSLSPSKRAISLLNKSAEFIMHGRLANQPSNENLQNIAKREVELKIQTEKSFQRMNSMQQILNKNHDTSVLLQSPNSRAGTLGGGGNMCISAAYNTGLRRTRNNSEVAILHKTNSSHSQRTFPTETSENMNHIVPTQEIALPIIQEASLYVYSE